MTSNLNPGHLCCSHFPGSLDHSTIHSHAHRHAVAHGFSFAQDDLSTVEAIRETRFTFLPHREPPSVCSLHLEPPDWPAVSPFPGSLEASSRPSPIRGPDCALRRSLFLIGSRISSGGQATPKSFFFALSPLVWIHIFVVKRRICLHRCSCAPRRPVTWSPGAIGSSVFSRRRAR